MQWEESGLNLRFLSRYAANQGLDPDIDWEGFVDWWSGLTGVERLHVDYALTTVQRGRDTFGQLQSLGFAAQTSSFLDVGCGQGGLVRAATEIGLVASGIEHDPGLFELARHLNPDAQIIQGDALAIHLNRKFDLIYSTEVLEHIASPRGLLRNMREWISDNGKVVLSWPNGKCFRYVSADGHFLRFGLTLLSRQEAKEAKFIFTGIPDSYEHMGEYYNLTLIEEWARREGFETQVIRVRADESAVDQGLWDLWNAYAWWSREERPNWPFHSGHLLRTRFLEYFAGAVSDWHGVQVGDQKFADYSDKYLTENWRLLLTPV